MAAAKIAILCQSEGNMMGGEYHGLSVMSYDTAEQSYIYYETTPGPTSPR